jgi:hypothetical protein
VLSLLPFSLLADAIIDWNEHAVTTIMAGMALT